MAQEHWIRRLHDALLDVLVAVDFETDWTEPCTAARDALNAGWHLLDPHRRIRQRYEAREDALLTQALEARREGRTT